MTLPDQDALATFGGALNDYLIGVADPTTDRPAAGANQAYADIAMMTITAPRAIVRFVGSATLPTLAGANPHVALWGSSVAPTLQGHTFFGSAGQVAITWPATVQDQLGVTHTLNLRYAEASIEGSTLGFAQASITASNVATVFLGNSAGAASDLVGVTILVFVY